MEKNKIYVVLCRRGLNRDICPSIHLGNHCTECPYVAYAERSFNKTKEEETEVEINTEDAQQ